MITSKEYISSAVESADTNKQTHLITSYEVYLKLYTERLVKTIKSLYGSISKFENSLDCKSYLLYRINTSLLKRDLLEKYESVLLHHIPNTTKHERMEDVNFSSLNELDLLFIYIYETAKEFDFDMTKGEYRGIKEIGYDKLIKDLSHQGVILYIKDAKVRIENQIRSYNEAVINFESIRNENNNEVKSILFFSKHGVISISISESKQEDDFFYNKITGNLNLTELCKEDKKLRMIYDKLEQNTIDTIRADKHSSFFTSDKINNIKYTEEMSKIKGSNIVSYIEYKKDFGLNAKEENICKNIRIENIQPKKVKKSIYCISNEIKYSPVYDNKSTQDLSFFNFSVKAILRTQFCTDKNATNILYKKGISQEGNKCIASTNIISGEYSKCTENIELIVLSTVNKYGISGLNRLINLYKNFDISNLFNIHSPAESFVETLSTRVLNKSFQLFGFEHKKDNYDYACKDVINKKTKKLVYNRTKNLLKNSFDYYLKTGSLLKVNELLNTDFNCIEMFFFKISGCMHEKSNYKELNTDYLFKKIKNLVSENEWILIKNAFKKYIKTNSNLGYSLNDFEELTKQEVFKIALTDRGVDINNIDIGILKDYIFNSIRLNKRFTIMFNSNSRLKQLHDDITKEFEYHTRGNLILPNKFAVIKFIFDKYLSNFTNFKYKLISTDTELYNEGKEQNHCVYTYKNDISSSKCYIWTTFSEISNQRITIETTTDFVLKQCKKRFNTEVSIEEKTIIMNDLEAISLVIKVILDKLHEMYKTFNKEENKYSTLYKEVLTGKDIVFSKSELAKLNIHRPEVGLIVTKIISKINAEIIINDVVDSEVIENNIISAKVNVKKEEDFLYYKDVINNLYTKSYIKTIKNSLVKTEEKFLKDLEKELKKKMKIIKKQKTLSPAEVGNYLEEYEEDDEFPF